MHPLGTDVVAAFRSRLPLATRDHALYLHIMEPTREGAQVSLHPATGHSREPPDEPPAASWNELPPSTPFHGIPTLPAVAHDIPTPHPPSSVPDRPPPTVLPTHHHPSFPFTAAMTPHASPFTNITSRHAYTHKTTPSRAVTTPCPCPTHPMPLISSSHLGDRVPPSPKPPPAPTVPLQRSPDTYITHCLHQSHSLRDVSAFSTGRRSLSHLTHEFPYAVTELSTG